MTDADTAQNASTTGMLIHPASRRRGWLVWLILLAVLGLLVTLSSLRDSRHFDDPLFDRYYHLIAKQPAAVNNGSLLRQLARRVGLKMKNNQPPELDFSEIRDWEAEYRDEPKYWELRATMLGCDAAVLDAFHRGVFSEGMLEAASPWVVFDADPALALKLCDQSIVAAPDNSYWYYRKSDLVFTQGHKPAALALVQQGNATLRNEHPRHFPMRDVLADHKWVRNNTDKLVAGWSCDHMYEPIVALTKMKRVARQIAADTANGADPGILDAYYTRYLRQGQMDNTDRLEMLVNLVEVGVTQSNKQEPFFALTAEQRKEFDDYCTARRGFPYQILLLSKQDKKQDPISDPLGWVTEWDNFVAQRDDMEHLAALFGKLLPAPHEIWKSGGLTGFRLDPELAALAAEADKVRVERNKKNQQ